MSIGDDLADFLLARNSEDQAAGFLAGLEDEQYGPIGNIVDGATDPRLELIRRFAVARIRLEAAVHRQLIEMHRPLRHGCPGTDDVTPCPTCGFSPSRSASIGPRG